MELISYESEDLYSKEIEVRMTIGELLMIKVALGDRNSTDARNSILENNPSHANFADKIQRQSLTTPLFNTLDEIFDKVTGGR